MLDQTGPAGDDGRVIVVTGGATGVGAEIVASYVANGAHVVVGDLAEPAPDAHMAEYFTVDVTNDDDLGTLVGGAVARYGHIDALVHCAAMYKALGGKNGLEDLAGDDWDRVLRVNVRGTWQTVKAVIPAMTERGGRIVTISSTAARLGTVGFAHYVASKAAVEGFTRAAARELGPRGITVNAVAPGQINNDATNTLNDPAYVAAAAARRAIPRQMYPADLVGAVRFLGSAGAAFITGQVLIVDGGGVFG